MMFPWNLFPNQSNQLNDWMKKLNESGLEQQFDQIFSKLKDNTVFSSQTQDKIEQKKWNDNIQIMETIDYVFVTIFLDDKINKDKFSVSYSYNQLYIRGLKDSEEILKIPLPSLVKKSNAEVRKADHIIEIRLPKFHDHHLVELDLGLI